VWHVTAVFFAALSVPGPTSDLVLNIAQEPPMRWYLDTLYLNQGHSFFAPEVGPGHVIQYECFDRNGQPLDRGELPSRKEHWPRLLYHRYFMLADQSDGWGDDKAARDRLQRMYLDAYARHLLTLNENVHAVRVRRFAHWPLPIDYLTSDDENYVPDRKRAYAMLANWFTRQGEQRRIDEQGFELLGETIQRRSDLQPASGNQSMNWPNMRANTAGRWSGGPPR
jgi:hypothetical protein